MIIEFFGAPGSGKTTISKKLTSLIKNDTILPSNVFLKKIFKFFLFIKYIILHPSVIKIYNIIKKSEQASKIEVFKLFFNHIYIISLYNEIPKNRLVIVDQGLVQSLWSILLKADNKIIDYESLLPNITNEIIYVFVKAEKDTISCRLKKREGKNSRIEQDYSLLNDSNLELFEKLYHNLNINARAVNYSVNGTNSVENNARYIINQINLN